MKLYYPKYYRNFQCIAGACPDSCCKEWEVDVDQESAARYRSLPGSLGDRLRQVLRDTDDGTVMTIENRRCPMWHEDGLCRIQAELGHDALCEVCRQFPRLRHDYGDFVELGLELSCPEAARLILSQPSQMQCEDVPGGEPGEYAQDVMETLLRTRREILDFLQDNGYSVPQALAVLLLYAYEVQNELDGGDAAVLSPAPTLQQGLQFAKSADAELFLDFFRCLEILTPQWQARLAQPAPGDWSQEFRALAIYFVQRYWLQAVSDYDLISRAKLTVCACLLIHLLGGNVIETAQLFSKEIENAWENTEAVLDGAYTSPALTDLQLLGLLLGV